MGSSDERERGADGADLSSSSLADALRGAAGVAGARLSDLGSAYTPDSGGRGGRARRAGHGEPPRDTGRSVRRVLAAVAGVVALAVLAPSTVTYVSPGHVGIVIHRAGGGVDRTPLGPGLHMRNPLLTAIEEYPTFMQTLVLTRGTTDGSEQNDEINVNSQEGQPLSLDVAMSFELDPQRVPQLYQTFRTDIV